MGGRTRGGPADTDTDTDAHADAHPHADLHPSGLPAHADAACVVDADAARDRHAGYRDAGAGRFRHAGADAPARNADADGGHPDAFDVPDPNPDTASDAGAGRRTPEHRSGVGRSARVGRDVVRRRCDLASLPQLTLSSQGVIAARTTDVEARKASAASNASWIDSSGKSCETSRA